MSSVSLNAGDTGWLDSVTCDLCGAKDERHGTGTIKRVPLSISDPRSSSARNVVQHGYADPSPEIEYEERRWDKDSHHGWGTFSVCPPGPTAPRQQLDLCPTCTAVFSDMLFERSKTGGWGTQEERAYGKEVPRLPSARMTTNLSAVGELGRAIGPSVAMGAIRGAIAGIGQAVREGTVPRLFPPPIIRDGFGNPLVARCFATAGRERCWNNAMPGRHHCYEHAALGEDE